MTGYGPLPGIPALSRRKGRSVALEMPGARTRTSLSLPSDLSQEDWLACGKLLSEIEGAVQWWIGDWWAFGAARQWGKSEAAADCLPVTYETAMNYGSVARAFQFSLRNENLSFDHHRLAMAAPAEERPLWLAKAVAEGLSSNQLRAAIAADELTGIGKVQVSRWRKRLGDEAKYREQQILAAYRKALVERDDWRGPAFQTCKNAASICRAFETSRRRDLVSFSHHAEVAGLDVVDADFWLDRTEAEDWSRNQLRAAIAQGAAFQRTRDVEFQAERLGKFVVIYADPPWRYENPPMGGSFYEAAPRI